jgi:homopolymeric O-antigen transport system ATP-binding protein
MSNLAIRVEGLSKRYEISVLRTQHDTLRDQIMDAATTLFRRNRDASAVRTEHTTRTHAFWALKDASFEVTQGEVLGVIGRNGAGKSTLLKILSRITEPTAGFADLYGRVGSLLEVGTGFHPELTGRENIYLNGTILGMSNGEIARKFDEIVDFSGVEQFIDTPVKRYSSGMVVRLAFAVAAHLEPEILLIDEALAVGDAAFQKKCIGKMGEVAKGGRTVLLVSHNMGYISALAERAILLERGTVKFVGETARAISTYLDDATRQSSSDLRAHPGREPGMTPVLISARLTDETGQERETFTTGEDWFLEMEYSCRDDTRLAGGGFNIRTRTGFRVGGFNTYMCSQPPYRIPTSGKLRFCIPKLPLNTGDFLVSVWVGVHPNEPYDWVAEAIAFSVVQSDFYGTGYILTSAPGPSVFSGSCEVLTGQSLLANARKRDVIELPVDRK